MISTWLVLSALAAEPPRWTLQIDPLTFALGYAHLQVERAVSPRVSLYAGPHLRLFSAPGSTPEPYVGLGGELGVRYYFAGSAPQGAWLLARGVLAHVRATDTGATALGGYGSALAGYTGVLAEHLVLSGGAGLQRIEYTVGDYGTRGWFPALHTAVGVAF